MLTTPIVDGDAPPAEGCFDIGPPRERNGLAHLIDVHASCGGIAPFDGRGVGFLVAHGVQGLLGTFVGAMGVANVDFD